MRYRTWGELDSSRPCARLLQVFCLSCLQQRPQLAAAVALAFLIVGCCATCHSLSAQEVDDVRAAFETFMDAVYAAVRQSGRFAWQMFWNGDSPVYSQDGMEQVALTGPRPLVTKANCSAQLRYFCSHAGQDRIHNVAMITAWNGGSTTPDAEQDIANFLLYDDCRIVLPSTTLSSASTEYVVHVRLDRQYSWSLCMAWFWMGWRAPGTSSLARPRLRPSTEQLLGVSSRIRDFHAKLQQVDGEHELSQLVCVN